MDQKERKTTFEEALGKLINARLSRVFTALPGIVQNVNAAKMTVDVKVAITGLFTDPDGQKSDLDSAMCTDVPLVFPGGGGAFLEFPVATNDEVLLVFSCRSMDNWFGSGNVQKQSEPGRMHNLSDAFAIAGIRSLPRAKTLDANVVRIRNDANSAYIEFSPTAGTVNIHAPGGITLNGVTVDSSGDIANVGTLASGNINSSGTVKATTSFVQGSTTLNVP